MPGRGRSLFRKLFRRRIVSGAGDSPERPEFSTLSHTFDVRFAPSGGIAAVLAEPANTLRWKGSGRLSISSESVTIAAKRGLLSLFARDRSRRIPAGQLREVYREGAALRLEFTGVENAREVMPLWAHDRESAAEIVRLLPTTRTVEVEQTTGRTPPKFRPDLRAIGGLFAGVLVIAAAVFVLQPSREAPPVIAASTRAEARPVVTTPELAPVEFPPKQLLIRLDDPVVPVPRGTRAYGIAQAQLALFEKESAALLEEYRTYRTQRETDVLTTEAFVEKLGNSLEMGWWNVTFRILEEPQFDDPSLVGLRATLLTAARNWRAFLNLYAEGQLGNDQVLISRSFALLERAEQMQARARLYVR
jgi:hypothetical protein